MMAYSLEQLGEALRRADAAGDVDAAKQLAAEYARRKAETTATGASVVAPAGAAGAPPTPEGAATTSGQGLKELFTKGIPQTVAAVAKGAGAMATLPIDAGLYAFDKLTGGDPTFGGVTQKMSEFIDRGVPPPKSKSGQLGVQIAALPATAAVAPGSFVRNLAAGSLGTAGGEAGSAINRAIDPTSSGMPGALLGGLIGGMPATLPKGRGNYQQMLSESLKGVSPGDFATAKRNMANAQAQGIPLTPEQAFPNPSGLDTLIGEVLQKGAGSGSLQRTVQGQPSAVLAAARNRGNQLGDNPGDLTAIRDMRLASEGAVADAGKTTAAARKLFQDDEARVSPTEMEALDVRLQGLKDAYRGQQETVARIEDLRKRLAAVTDVTSVPLGTRTVSTFAKKGAAKQFRTDTEVPTSVEVNMGASAMDTDAVVKSVDALLKDIGIGTPAMERLMSGRVGSAVGGVKDLLDQIVTTRPQGAAIYRSMKERQEALTQSLVGKLAGRQGVNTAAPDPEGLLVGALGGPAKKDKDIAMLASVLRERAVAQRAGGELEGAAQATRALPQAARTIWDRAVGKAFDNASDARTPAQGGAALASDLIGTPNKEANFRALMQGSGQALGADPKDFANGMVSFLQAVKQSANNRSGLSFGTGEAIEGLSSAAARATPKIAATGAASPAWGAVTAVREGANRLGATIRQKQFQKLASIFEDPNAIQLIEELGRTPKATARSAAILQNLLAVGTSTAAQSSNKESP